MLNDDLQDSEDSIDYAVHRTDDPNVWGLADVARGRTPLVPTTIYKIAGDSASGVVGLLFSSGEFLSALRSNVGQEFHITPIADEPFDAETVWDGAVKQPSFVVEGEERRERSKGILLGGYQFKRLAIPKRDLRHELKRAA